eukprot:8314898-Alexandrium_andersonii.AAC.1
MAVTKALARASGSAKPPRSITAGTWSRPTFRLQSRPWTPSDSPSSVSTSRRANVSIAGFPNCASPSPSI